MPFIPHTKDDIKHMLRAIGAPSIDALFDEIPLALRDVVLDNVPTQRSEFDVARLMHERASKDGGNRYFIGAGAYEHHIPAAVWEITTRGEFYSAYTPYQAEASQGTLQLLYEFQTMMVNLTGMDVSNASLYDGASALAEAVLMAVRSNRGIKGKRVLLPQSLHPRYRKTVHTIVRNQGIEIDDMAYDASTGRALSASSRAQNDVAAVVIAQPNFFGVLEDVDALTDWAHAKGAMVIAVVNPTSLAILKPPGTWGRKGADIACGDGQPLGVPLSSGGPYFGFLCTKNAYVRQMPGRIVGRTLDSEGNPGFTLTLQPREQHIRRSKATSNICTNQGLLVTAATIYMSLLGAEGLARVAAASHANTRRLCEKLNARTGIKEAFRSPYFHEVVLKLPGSVPDIIAAMTRRGIVPGYDLGQDYPELKDHMLVCVTETKSEQDLDDYCAAVSEATRVR